MSPKEEVSFSVQESSSVFTLDEEHDMALFCIYSDSVDNAGERVARHMEKFLPLA
jgi:hypothetical protein